MLYNCASQKMCFAPAIRPAWKTTAPLITQLVPALQCLGMPFHFHLPHFHLHLKRNPHGSRNLATHFTNVETGRRNITAPTNWPNIILSIYHRATATSQRDDNKDKGNGRRAGEGRRALPQNRFVFYFLFMLYWPTLFHNRKLLTSPADAMKTARVDEEGSPSRLVGIFWNRRGGSTPNPHLLILWASFAIDEEGPHLVLWASFGIDEEG